MRRHKTTIGLPALLLLSTLLLSGLLPGVGGLPGLGSVAWAEIRQPVTQLALWNRGECTRINNTSFSVPDTARNVAIYRPGVPMRYGDTYGVWMRGLISSVVDAGTTLTVTFYGASMTVSYDGICEYGSETLLRYDTIVVPGAFADADDATLLLHDLKMIVPPQQGKTRYLLVLCAKQISNDTGGSQPRIRTIINGSAATGYATMSNISWVCTAPFGYEPYYDLQYNETWEIEVDADTGVNKDSSDLTVQLVWLQEE